MTHQRVKQIGFFSILSIIFFISIANVFAQGGAATSQDRSSDNKTDQNLKSIARVNPSTLAMEMSVPLMNYPGRNGNSLPIGFSYSSKLWRMKSMATYFYTTPIGNYRQYVTQLRPMFAERSAAGWTSSVAFPVIEEKLETYDQTGNPFKPDIDMESFDHFYQMANNADPSSSLVNNANLPCGSVCVERTRWCIGESCTEWQCTGYDWNTANCDGGGGGGNSCEYVNGYCPASCNFCTNPTQCPPWNPTCDNPDNTPPYQAPRKMHYVKRVYVRMGDGATHEFRKSDAVFGYCNGGNDDGPNCEPITPDNYGMFLSVDGSGMKLKRTTEGSTLYLPNGSRYTFTSDATGVFDGKSLYQAREFIDADGNRSQFNFTEEQNQLSANNQHLRKFTDTLGREIYDPFPQNLSEQTQKEGVQTINLPGLSSRGPQSYQLKWLHLKPVPCNPPDVTTNCGSTEGALENQNENVYFYTAKTCAGSAETPVDPNNLYPNQKLFPLDGIGLRSCIQSNSGASPDVLRFNPVVLAEISMSNGKKYEFKYNQFGEITKIIYPTGSYETFKYDKIAPMNGFNESAYDQTNRGVKERKVYNSDGGLEQFWRYGAEFQYNNYTNETYKITITAPRGDNPSLAGAKTERYLYVDTRNQHNFGFSDPRAGMPKEEKTYDENGVLRARTLTEWIFAAPRPGGDSKATRDARPARSVSVIIEGNKALAMLDKTEYDELGTPGNNAQTDPEFFSHLNVKRKKGYHYKPLSLSMAQTGSLDTIADLFIDSTGLAAVSETDYQYAENYKNRGISSLPIESRALNPANTSEVLAKTQTVFDEPAYLTPGSGSLTGSLINTWKNPATDSTLPNNSDALRGKPTTAKTWHAETNSWIQIHTQYDQYGNVRKIWEPNEDVNSNRYVETEYSADYGFAYPTRIITSAPDPTGIHGTNQTSQSTTIYDLMTGLPLTMTDDFGQTTKTEYEDALLRPTKVSGVGNYIIPITETIYDDTNFTVKVRKQIDETNWDEETKYFDSLGRTFKTQSKDSQGNVFTETKYDFLGRVQMTTNPYRLGDTAKYWNLTEYDTLGRVKQTREPVLNQNPDQPTGNILASVEHDLATAGDSIGIAITAIDASGRKNRSITNVLGQLLRVDEPSSTNTLDTLPTPSASPTPSPTPRDNGCYELAMPDPNCRNNLTSEFSSLPTHYKYDERGNLKEVKQGEQIRTFTYDSFSHIKSASNPESGLVEYTYDILGNIKTKRDARGIKTIYDYDKWNRIIKRCFRVIGTGNLGATSCAAAQNETPEPNTPDVAYFYDGVNLAQQEQQTPNFAKGKLTKISSSVSDTLYTSFDNFGRILTHQQITGGKTYSTSYKYNLSGALIEETYPSGKIVRNFFDGDQDLSSVVYNGKVYASDFSYTPEGAIEKMRLGNGNWELTSYNRRLQPTQFGLGNAPNNTTNLWKINYEYGELQSDGTTVDATKNNGSIAKQIITVPTINSTQGFVATQTYSYDALNRLKQAKETIPNQSGWQQTFSYDRFGNRNFDEADTDTLPKTCLENSLPVICTNHRKSLNPTVNQANNRLGVEDGYEYDAAGNMTKDAESRRFVYDALNKQTQIKNDINQVIGNYFYDGEGKRIKKTGNLENTLFVYDALGSLIAEYKLEDSQPNPPRQTSYLTNDTLGNPRVVTGKTGEVISRRDFLPFGEEITANENTRKSALGYASSGVIRQAFTGYEKDAESDLEFAQNRYYSNKHGRYTTPDPMMASGKVWNPQSWNRYSYVNNNPLNLTDPLGLDPAKTPWWYSPCAGCTPTFGTGYTDASQLITPGALIYTNLEFSNRVWALNPITGAVQSFPNTASGWAEAAEWLVTTGAGAVLREAAFAVALSALIASPMAAFPHYYPDNINECGRNGICVPYYSEEKLKKMAEENPSDGHLIKMVSEPDQMSSAPPASGGQSTPAAQPPEDPNKPNQGPSGKTSTEKYLEKRWDKATFGTVKKSIEYHVGKHGKGLTATQYTQQAMKNLNASGARIKNTTDLQGRAARQVTSQYGTGLYTKSGKIIWFHPK